MTAVPDPRFRDQLAVVLVRLWGYEPDDVDPVVAAYDATDALMPTIAAEVEARVELRARIRGNVSVSEAGCWLWQASKLQSGYGQIQIANRKKLAHRIAYEEWRGPVPEGLVLDHLCRVRHCVNPAHLEPVTQQVNTLRGVGPAALHAAKTHCPRRHPYSPENTRVSRQGKRHCRACERDRDRRRRPAIRPALASPVPAPDGA